MSHQWDEIIYRNSGRLAKHKTYTGLENIPRYQMLTDKGVVCIENQIITTSQLNGIKEKTPIDSGLASNDADMKDNESLEGEE